MPRQATAADIEAIVAVTNLAYEVEHFFTSVPRLDAREVESHMRRGVFVVVDGDTGVVASGYLEITDDKGYLGLLAVHPARQGLGLGRGIADAIEARCREAGCRRLEIHVVNLREELFPYYERLGFTRTGATRPLPDDGHTTRPCHLVVMDKAL